MEQEKSIYEWTARFEKQLDRQGQQIDSLAAAISQVNSALSADIAKVTANVETLLNNQSSIFNRQNRPFQWGAFVSALIGVGVFAGLALAPVQEKLDDADAFHKDTITHLVQDAREMGALEARVEWLMMMEDRLNRRLHNESGQ